MNSSKSNCSAIVPGPTFLASTVWLAVSSLASIVGNLFVLLVLHRSHSLHSNVRLLLKSFTAASCLLSVSLFSKSVYHFYVWKFGFFPMTPTQCAFFELVWDLGSSSAALSIACIGLERMLSTIWKKTYADFDRPSPIAYRLLAACWINGLLTPSALILLSALAQPQGKTLCYCHVVFSAPPYFMYFLVPAYTALETSTLVFYLILYRHSRAEFTNFTINTTQHSLAQRYQMLNNINTIVLLMPTIIIHGVCYVAVTAALTYLMSIVRDQNPTSTVIDYVSLLTDLFSTEPLLQAALLIWGNQNYRNIALGYFPRLRNLLCTTNRVGNEQNGSSSCGGALRRKAAKKAGTTYMVGGGGTQQQGGIVDFRMGPQLNDDILKAIWNTKG